MVILINSQKCEDTYPAARVAPCRTDPGPFPQPDQAVKGAEAVQLAGLYKPDIILIDLRMPGINGITAAREIHQKYPQVKIIALTSFSEQNLVQGGFSTRQANRSLHPAL
jgi:DNA-binding NarL/FixJ family response regulator